MTTYFCCICCFLSVIICDVILFFFCDLQLLVGHPAGHHPLSHFLRRPIVSFTVPVCYRPICRKVVCAGVASAAGWSQGTGCLDSYLRMISCRSATAVNGSQLARWLCSLLSVAWHLSHPRAPAPL